MSNTKDLQIDQSIEDLERITAKLKHQLKGKADHEVKILGLSITCLKEKNEKNRTNTY